MEQYNRLAEHVARLTTNTYSTSFGTATKLFPKQIRQDIYNIYGLVRLADEIVDTYAGADAAEQLHNLEQETYRAMASGYSTNFIVHAFAQTTRRYTIGRDLVTPFFYSMRLDTAPQHYTPTLYARYIDGSAEVVGLMCLKVFVSDSSEYEHLEPGARSLGAAFQKVNFLRDLAADKAALGRYYFPESTYETFDDSVKAAIIADIEHDFAQARQAIPQLPPSAQPAVSTAYAYFVRLLWKLKAASAADLLTRRVRINNAVKLGLLGKTVVRSKLIRGKA